ncbi:hypothetical protein PFISCL1PPCAC_11376, partial [Pristionchus fissidentatus]
VDESVILKTLRDVKNGATLEECRPVLALIYQQNNPLNVSAPPGPGAAPVVVGRCEGALMTLNAQQSRAVTLYQERTRAFCILSPPGSGKTTVSGGVYVAAAMAAEVDRGRKTVGGVVSSCQLLIAVQNVAVDNIGSALRNVRTARPRIVLATVEMLMGKMITAKSHLYENALSKVTRVIIDEASLLTEAALFCLIWRFPQAQFVFIGDDKQLPPFMYDPRILGHELAGRSALSVVMKNGNIPIISLEEVYRAPPSLVEPYNRLSYEGRLLSRKNRPQLLFVQVDGKQERDRHSMSLHNNEERAVVMGLLRRFPTSMDDDIMIICLYKEQKRR